MLAGVPESRSVLLLSSWGTAPRGCSVCGVAERRLAAVTAEDQRISCAARALARTFSMSSRASARGSRAPRRSATRTSLKQRRPMMKGMNPSFVSYRWRLQGCHQRMVSLPAAELTRAPDMASVHCELARRRTQGRRDQQHHLETTASTHASGSRNSPHELRLNSLRSWLPARLRGRPMAPSLGESSPRNGHR